jgi:hypothetical protein
VRAKPKARLSEPWVNALKFLSPKGATALMRNQRAPVTNFLSPPPGLDTFFLVDPGLAKPRPGLNSGAAPQLVRYRSQYKLVSSGFPCPRNSADLRSKPCTAAYEASIMPALLGCAAFYGG